MEDEIQEYFSKFAEVVDSFVVYNTNTGRPSGFGFVTIKRGPHIEKIMKDDHYINDAKVSSLLFLFLRLILKRLWIRVKPKRRKKRKERGSYL